jgi:hypothetical protein
MDTAEYSATAAVISVSHAVADLVSACGNPRLKRRVARKFLLVKDAQDQLTELVQKLTEERDDESL